MLILLQILALFYAKSHCYQNILELNDRIFHKELSLNKYALVIFYNASSTLFQQMHPHFVKASEILAESNLPIICGEMNCSNNAKNICRKKQIRDVVIEFYNEQVLRKVYEGPLDVHSVVKFVKNQILPPVLELKTLDEYKKFLKNQHEAVVVGLFQNESKLKDVFYEVAEEMYHLIDFAYSSCEKVLIKQGVSDGVVVIRPEKYTTKYEEDVVLFKQDPSFNNLTDFIIGNYYGLVGRRTVLNQHHFSFPLIILYYYVHPMLKGIEAAYWKHRMIKVAYDYRDSCSFAVSNKDEFEDEVKEFEFEFCDPIRPFVLGRKFDEERYVMNEIFCNNTFRVFVDDFVNDKLTRYIAERCFYETAAFGVL